MILVRITKLGHSCLLIEQEDVRILIDPGVYSSGQNELTDLDALLITHEHPDHFDGKSVQQIASNNPGLKIITVSSVGDELNKMSIKYEVIEHGQNTQIKGIEIEGIGSKHDPIHSLWPESPNTGYLIGGKLFCPGDALTPPNREIDILAFPSVGPYMSIADGIDYVLKTKPRVCFPYHDAVETGFANVVLEEILKNNEITFVVPELGTPVDL